VYCVEVNGNLAVVVDKSTVLTILDFNSEERNKTYTALILKF